jgi:hypothetical protein
LFANVNPGLSVHLNQVHKETLQAVENSIPQRANLDVEIFGMEGIPEDIVASHNQKVINQFQQAEAARRAATGNTGAQGGQNKKPKFETPAEIKARLAAHKAAMAEKAAGGSSGGATPAAVGGQSPAPTQSPAIVVSILFIMICTMISSNPSNPIIACWISNLSPTTIIYGPTPNSELPSLSSAILTTASTSAI